MSALQPLEPVNVPVPDANPGRPPQLQWLPLASLRIDPAYQRPIINRGIKTIAKIVADFKWSRFSPLIVAPVPSTITFTIIDGQHRATAALVRGYDKVPCCIADVPPDEAARVFAAVNGTVTPMSIQSLFKAARIAGEDWAVAIDRACASAGIEPLVYPVPRNKMKPKQTLAIGTLREAVHRFGEEQLSKALQQEARKSEANEPGYFNSDAIRNALFVYRGGEPKRAERPALTPHLAPVPMARNEPEIIEKIRWLKGKGYSRQYIATTLKCTYAQIEQAFAGAQA